MRYLTGLRAQIIAGKSAILNGCLLVADHVPILLASGGEIERVRLVMPWIEEVHAVPIMEARGLVRGMVETTLRPLLSGSVLEMGASELDECGFALVEASASNIRIVTSSTATRRCMRRG